MVDFPPQAERQRRGQQYDHRLSGEMSGVLRHHNRRRPLVVRPDGLAHLDDVSRVLAATRDEVMHVALLSEKAGILVSSTCSPRSMACGSAP